MRAAARGVAQQAAAAEGIDAQDIVARVVSVLAAITLLLCKRVLGADEASCRPVMGNRGDAGARRVVWRLAHRVAGRA